MTPLNYVNYSSTSVDSSRSLYKPIGFILCLLMSPVFSAENYDLAIVGGRVMDPASDFDEIANVGITGDRIAVITKEPITGDKTIDASGHVIAPGFIDTHFHGTQPLHYRLALRMGVTTAMDLEFGALGTRVDDWYSSRDGTSLINYGTSVSHELARASVLDGVDAIDTSEASLTRVHPNWAGLVPTADESEEILAIIDEGLRSGAIGVGSTLGYMPGASANELFDVQALSASYGRQIGVHLRHTPGTETDEINGAQEVLANAAALNAPAIINHFNNPGWQRVHELITRMQTQGHNVWGEIYPYAAGATTINAVFFDPSNWRDRLGRRYEDTMLDPSTNEFLTEGQYLSLRESDPTRVVVVFKNPEEEIVQWLGLDGISIASDGLPDLVPRPLDSDLTQLPNAHPRTAGTYAKALRLARENHLSLMAILKQASTTSAIHFAAMGLDAMQDRGKVQENAIADLVVFNPETVTDNSTYRKGTLPSTGFKAVLVSGTVVLEEDKVLLETTAGKPIRFTPVGQ